MKIIFCSNFRGQNGTTTNMLSAAVLSDILYDKKSILLQTQTRQNRLEIPLLDSGKRKYIKKEAGIDSLIKSIIAGRCTKDVFGKSCVSLINSSIDFIPGCNTSNMKYNKDPMSVSLHEILELAEELYEMVFIDAGVITGQTAEILYEKADMVVMCLNQNKRVLDDYFGVDCVADNSMQYNKSEKTAYIISSFDKYSIYGKEKLLRLYPGLKNENTFFIPYNVYVKDAVSESNLFTFFYRNITCDKTDINYEYVQSLLKLVRFINK